VVLPTVNHIDVRRLIRHSCRVRVALDTNISSYLAASGEVAKFDARAAA
jgi:hypothetical protein